jgi:hypothetical protein
MNVLSDPGLTAWLPPIVLIVILLIGWLLRLARRDEPAPAAPAAPPAHGETHGETHGESAHGESAHGGPAPAHH